MMVKWKYRLDLKDAWKRVSGGGITPAMFAREVVKKLDSLMDVEKDEFSELEIIRDDFECLAEHPETAEDDIDEIMDNLYDWGDTILGKETYPTKRMCWISTEF